MQQKESLRKTMRQKLDRQTRSERRKNSRIIQRKLFIQKEFLASKSVMLYVSKGTKEVQTGPIIKNALNMGKEVYLPVTLVRERKLVPVRFKNLRQGMKKSEYGIYEPKESNRRRPLKLKDIDLVIVPGLAFDKKYNRLGHGQGYYDKFLKCLPKNTHRIGLGFRFQLLRSIPTTRRDTSLTKVITN